MQVATRPVPQEELIKADVATGRRLPQIDILRAFACLWVLAHHAYSLYPHTEISDWICSRGYLGVNLFLVLSGFCLARPIVQRGGWLRAQPSFISFMRRRCLRILPPYYAALILAIVFVRFMQEQPVTASDMLAHFFMVQNLSADWVANINGAFWSLGLEFHYYLVFILIVTCLARYGTKTMLVAAMALSLAWEVAMAYTVGQDLNWKVGVTHQALLPGACVGFIIGMYAAELEHDTNWYEIRHRWLLALVGILAAVYAFEMPRFEIGQNIACGLAFGMLTLFLARVPAETFLRWKVLVALESIGVFSYSIYLIHQPLVNYSFLLLVMRSHSVLVAQLLQVPLIVAIAYLFHRAVERPFMKRPKTAVE